MKFDMNSLLKDQNVLRIIALVSVFNLLGYLRMQNLDAVAFFIIIGFLTTYFSKNMIIVLLVSMIATNFLVMSRAVGKKTIEGMTDGKEKIVEIIKEAVDIEKEFICEALPCRLISMNSKLMSDYIEFVADRLACQLGCDKIYGTTNPFDFMELISVEGKTNFFEKRVGEYALANKERADDVFDLDGAF